jgi:hypothetical protein
MSTPFVIIDEIAHWWEMKTEGTLPDNTPSPDYKLFQLVVNMISGNDFIPLQKFIQRVTSTSHDPSPETLAKNFLMCLIDYSGKDNTLEDFCYTDPTRSFIFSDTTFPDHTLYDTDQTQENIQEPLERLTQHLKKTNLCLNQNGVPIPGEYVSNTLHHYIEYLDNGHHDPHYHGSTEPDHIHPELLCDIMTDKLYHQMNRYAYAVLHLTAAITYTLCTAEFGYQPDLDGCSTKSLLACTKDYTHTHVSTIPSHLAVLPNDPDLQIAKAYLPSFARYLYHNTARDIARLPIYLTPGSPHHRQSSFIDIYALNGTDFWFMTSSGTLYSVDLADPEMANDDLGDTYHDHLVQMIYNIVPAIRH